MTSPRRSTRDFESVVSGQTPPPMLELRLYVAGSSFRSTKAIQNAKELCEEHFAGRYQLEVIDIFQQPDRARADDVLAVPVLIRRRPLPSRRFIGDLSDRDSLLMGLDARGR
ncbi:MAG TPA: circadian clock KaiB family protein [Kofleriaceae bacterium]|nr:circadian clock KaiB family protein [Kofleriaceae bacterium]